MKILLVEDDPMLRDGLVDLLQGAGHDVEEVVDVVADGEVLDGRPEGFWRRLLIGRGPDEEKIIAALQARTAGAVDA